MKICEKGVQKSKFKDVPWGGVFRHDYGVMMRLRGMAYTERDEMSALKKISPKVLVNSVRLRDGKLHHVYDEDEVVTISTCMVIDQSGEQTTE